MMETTKNQLLYLTEIFCSIQGETSLSGIPTTFIRLSGCNLRCSWCDTPYSFSRGNQLTLTEILDKVCTYGVSHVCITGGEPLLQKNIYHLMRLLCDEGYVVNLETSGSLSISQVDFRVITILDIKCPGSGMSQKNAWGNLAALRPHDEVKFVIKNRLDYDWALGVCEKYQLFSRSKLVLFSPEHNNMNPQELVKWILKDRLPVRINLQIHKWIWDSQTQGV